jgi:hypothetical protein
MASGWTPFGLSESELSDGEAYHRALYHGGSTDNPTTWHSDSVKHLNNLVLPHIEDGAVIVDYGSGTGGSAIELLKVLDERGISVKLILIDPLVSWFYKAREILGERDNIHFELSIAEDENGGMIFRTMKEILGDEKADVIISASTLHLVPEKALPDLGAQFASSLTPNGIFVWNSGDIESNLCPDNSALLHDPYRMVREHLRDDTLRKSRMEEMGGDYSSRFERRVDRIFPIPYSIDVILDAFDSAGLECQLSSHVVEFSAEDAERFILVPRLAAIAAPLHEGDERDSAVKDAIRAVLSKMRVQGTASEVAYRSHWVYGFHKLA